MFDMLTSPYTHPLKKLIWMRLKAGARAVWETISGNPVSFSAKAAPLRKLEVAFSPTQDLNGYENPWPAGGGKNLLDETQLTNGTYNGSGTYVSHAYYAATPKITITGGETYSWSISKSLTNRYATYWDSDDAFISQASLGAGTEATVIAPAAASYIAFSGSYATPVDLSEVKPAQVNKGSVQPYSPYSNECPISGWSSLTVEQRGKNLLDWQTKIKDYLPIVGLHYVPIDLPRNTTLTFSDDYGQWNGKYFLQLTAASNASEWAAGAWRVILIDANAGNRMKYTFTTPDTDEQLYLRFYESAKYFDYCTWMQIEVGSDNTAYEEYSPSSRSISINLGQTVYSGTVDVVTGVGEVTWAAVDLGSLTWVYEPTNKYFYSSTITSQLYNPLNYQSHEQGILSDRFVVPDIAVGAADSLWATMPTNTIAKHCGAKNYIYLKKTEYTSPIDLQAAVTGSQLVFKLATSQSIQLTPQEVESLLGENNLWSNANQPLTVTYRSN